MTARPEIRLGIVAATKQLPQGRGSAGRVLRKRWALVFEDDEVHDVGGMALRPWALVGEQLPGWG